MTYHQNFIKSNKADAISEETKECIAIPERLSSPLDCLVLNKTWISVMLDGLSWSFTCMHFPTN
jgi:hypothetical protein